MEPRKQNISIEIPAALLEQIDILVDSWEFESRSAAIEQALREMLGPMHTERTAGDQDLPPYWPVL